MRSRTGYRLHLAVVGAMLLPLVLGACGGDPAGAQAAPADPPTEQPATATAAPVVRIVFVDQEECCDCTRARTDATWAALQEALADRPELPVERIHGDSQEEQAAPYLAMRPLMVVPGLYFLDADGQLVEMLQGELTGGQIAPLLP